MQSSPTCMLIHPIFFSWWGCVSKFLIYIIQKYFITLSIHILLRIWYTIQKSPKFEIWFCWRICLSQNNNVHRILLCIFTKFLTNKSVLFISIPLTVEISDGACSILIHGIRTARLRDLKGLIEQTLTILNVGEYINIDVEDWWWYHQHMN